jgi:cation transport ATPase
MIDDMGTARIRHALAPARSTAGVMLVLTLSGLAAGLVLHAAGASQAGNGAWLAAGLLGAGYALWAVGEALLRRQMGVDIIALLAVGGAIAVGELLAASVIAVMLASGRALEAWAAGRAHRDLQALLQRAPRIARRYQGDVVETVPLEAVIPGDLLMVAPGDLVPADGTLASAAVLDESALTGEALPIERAPGEPVRSGVLNTAGPFDLRVTATAADSTYAGVIRLVSQAEASQPPFVRLADRYAAWFLAVTLAVAPVAWVSGLSVSARRGVVVKGGAVLERLARCTTLLLDKTGTLTGGHPAVATIIPAGSHDPADVLRLAASLDQVSGHVLAAAVVEAAAKRGLPLSLPTRVREVPGQGIRGVVAGQDVTVGKAGWAGVTGTPAWAKAARRRARLDGALTVFVGVDGAPAGVLVLSDPVRPDAARTIRTLRQDGINRIVMVTGDRSEVAEALGTVLGIDEVLAERTPAEKLDAVRLERRSAPVIMAGDGINDAPALALADVGVALAARGAGASSEAADAVLTVDRIARLGEVTALARRTRRIARQSVLAGMAMSLVAMAAAAAGLLPAVWGALLQEAIDVAVILNALRALRPGTRQRLAGADAALTTRFAGEHETIRPAIDQLRAAADSLGVLPAGEAIARARAAYLLLTEQIAPHEAAEEHDLYPALDRILGGHDATATMSRAHADIADLRALLYGLHAILRLHTAQEDESYLSLDDADLVAARPGGPDG